MATPHLCMGMFWVLLSATTAPEEKPMAERTKVGLSMSVSLVKNVFRSTDEVRVSFKLKNDSTRDLFIADGHLAPRYHEAGPGRHFEVCITADSKTPLQFWSGLLSEGEAAGIRNVFKLKPGETYEGSILIAAAAGKEKEESPGTLRAKDTNKRHVLGKDGRKYALVVRYQVDPKTHGVWKPPAEFKQELLWKGVLTSNPVEFEVTE